MKRIFQIAALLLTANSIQAQNNVPDAVVQVENDYNPVVIKAEKQSFTPQIEITSNNTPLDLLFSQEAAPFGQFVSQRNVKEVLPQQTKQFPGYARLGYGNNNNIDARLGYRLQTGKNSHINMLAAFNGFKTGQNGLEGDWNSRFYNTVLSAGYTHYFEKFTIGAGAALGNKVFNYQLFEALAGTGTDKQNSNSFNLQFNIKSNLSGALSYEAEAGYTLNSRKYANGQKERISENRFNAKGCINYELPNEDIYRMGAILALDGFTYNNALKPDEGLKYDNYTSIRFNPFMNFRFDDWKVKLGVHFDMLTANGTFMAFAPDCSIEGMLNKNVSLYATVTGGRTLNGFEAMEQISPYWDYVSGINGQYTATYKIFDVTTGTRLAFAPFSTNLYVGYAYTKDDLLATDVYAVRIHTLFEQHNTRSLYLGGRFGYDYNGWFNFLADARYDHISCSGPEFWLMYKPQITLDLNAEARLYKGLYANIGYKFIRYTKSDSKLVSGRIENMNNLCAKISYRIDKRLSAYVTANNLLSSDYFAYPGYQVQGAHFLAGVTFGF